MVRGAASRASRTMLCIAGRTTGHRMGGIVVVVMSVSDFVQFAAKPTSAVPPVVLRSACEQPPSGGPRDGCDNSRILRRRRRPRRRGRYVQAWPHLACCSSSSCRCGRRDYERGPSIAFPSARRGGSAYRPAVDDFALLESGLLGRARWCRAARHDVLGDHRSPEFFHGPLPMRSRALMAGLPSAACVDR